MSNKRHKPEEIVAKLRQVGLLSLVEVVKWSGPAPDLVRHHDILVGSAIRQHPPG